MKRYLKAKQALIAELSIPHPGTKDLLSFLVQFVACVWKQRWWYWRNPTIHCCMFRVHHLHHSCGRYYVLGSQWQKEYPIRSDERDGFNVCSVSPLRNPECISGSTRCRC